MHILCEFKSSSKRSPPPLGASWGRGLRFWDADVRLRWLKSWEVAVDNNRTRVLILLLILLKIYSIFFVYTSIVFVYTGGSTMIAKVSKWGNSLGLRIPSAFAKEIGLEPQSVVEIQLVNNELVISRSNVISPTLDELLSKITPENLHGEIDFGNPVGNEVW